MYDHQWVCATSDSKLLKGTDPVCLTYQNIPAHNTVPEILKGSDSNPFILSFNKYLLSSYYLFSTKIINNMSN